MSDYIYAIIPYQGNKKYRLEELEEGLDCFDLPGLKGLDTEYADNMTLFNGYILVNTCFRLSSFTELEDGYSSIRADIYRIARALGASEVWYIAELCTDEMDAEGFSFEKWANRLKNDKKLVVEMTVDILKGKLIYNYYHDDFADVVLTKPVNDGKKHEFSDKVCDITQIVSLRNNGGIKIELKDFYYNDIYILVARTLREANVKIRAVLAERHIAYPNRVNITYKDKQYCIPRTMISQFIKALDLASWKHRKQKDKEGKPFFGHIARVSNICKTPAAKVVALLHDLIADTDVTPNQLEELGMSEFVIKAVLCLTRHEGEPYEDFIKRLAKNPIAREVKIADLEDYMDDCRINELKEENIELTEKYLKA